MAAMYEFLRTLTALGGGFLVCGCFYPHCRSPHPRCHSPRKRGIQYAAASRLNQRRLGVLGRPVKPGDDSELLCRLQRRPRLLRRDPECIRSLEQEIGAETQG
ncbi:hypothetical protein F8237_12620 [Bradyrhizobium betae]|uniref:Uncharacterized protein n=1 Tax=Bradyrhizobium betae TaxID=244734 RepID=A0A5P6P578_9BRAD|nr:hypothetical protein F8237_12620 [Bradyrhizobium betae]